jgi:hypothetical protein
MSLHKTEKARAELMPGQRSLPQRERTLMLLADGTKSAKDFRGLFGGEGEQIAMKLLREGFLETRTAASAQHSKKSISVVLAALPGSGEATTAATPGRQAPETASMTSGSTDPFDGKRSLATTRMFLFDICERMFARRNPALAEKFREALRQARDRETMLSASRAMLEEIEEIAGPERADSISERIAMLLPPEMAMRLT